MKRLQVYTAPDITVTFDPNVCIHSGVCLATLPGVFDVQRARWIRPEAASPDRIAHAIDRCPSGALQYYRNVEQDRAAAFELSRAVALHRIALTMAASGSPEARGRAVANAVREAGSYAWVGLYRVDPAGVTALAWSGDRAPTHPRFDWTLGLNGAAAAERRTIVSNDVAADARYLATFADTRAELVAPVVDSIGAEVVGTIDVAATRAGAFSDRDVELVEACARAAAALWER